MSALASAAAYAGRTFDVLAFQGAKATGDTLLVNALATSVNDSGEICTGVQKLAQRWLIEFLTIQGTLAYLPTRGCEFMFLVQTGQLRTTLDAEQAFYLAASQVKTNLQAEELGTEPDDERFDSVNLISIVVTGDKLTLYTQINSLAGTSRSVILPIPVTIKN
jgi:hypothetical protein